MFPQINHEHVMNKVFVFLTCTSLLGCKIIEQVCETMILNYHKIKNVGNGIFIFQAFLMRINIPSLLILT